MASVITRIDDAVRAMYEEQFKDADDLGVTPLGSGSHYTVFLQHIGVSEVFRHLSRSLAEPSIM